MPMAVGSLAPKIPTRSGLAGEHVRGLVERGGHVGVGVLRRQKGELRVRLDVVIESTHAPDLGTNTGNVRHDLNFAFGFTGFGEQVDHRLGAGFSRRLVVGGEECRILGRVTIEFGVDNDDGDASVLGLFYGRLEGGHIRGSKYNRLDTAVDRALDDVDLFVDVALGLGAEEGDRELRSLRLKLFLGSRRLPSAHSARSWSCRS